MQTILILVSIFLVAVDSFIPFSRLLSTQQKAAVSNGQQQLNAYDPDKNVFGSKLMPDFTEEELADIFKEFNITNFDVNKDPEIAKWAPSKQFFETYGFQNNTERYKKKTADVKVEFYSQYTKPILPQYKTFIADVMAMTFIQSVDSRYKYDALHAFGICTQYYTIMKGYALQDEIDVIFNLMMKAVGFDPAVIRADAKRILGLIKESTLSEDDFLASTEGEIAEILNNIRKNRFFKYTDAWGIGLARLMELKGVEPNLASFEKWSKSLRWVFSPRLMQSYDEFCGDQLRMQGVVRISMYVCTICMYCMYVCMYVLYVCMYA